MESSGSEEELSDMKRPPLVRDLRAILEEYPDNGQIFKVVSLLSDHELHESHRE